MAGYEKIKDDFYRAFFSETPTPTWGDLLFSSTEHKSEDMTWPAKYNDKENNKGKDNNKGIVDKMELRSRLYLIQWHIWGYTLKLISGNNCWKDWLSDGATPLLLN